MRYINTSKPKYFLILLILISVLVNAFGQRDFSEFEAPLSSEKLFISEVSRRDSMNDIQIPYLDHLYFRKEVPCFRYIFRPGTEVDFENLCPGDYSWSDKFGVYNYLDENTIEIISDTLSIYRNFVDRIESKSNSNSKLEFEILDENLNLLGKTLTVYYTKRPTFFNKRKSISIRHDDLEVILNKNVLLESICIESFVREERSIYYIPFNWKMKPIAVTYSIVLRRNGYRIIHEDNMIFLYKWNFRNRKFEKVDELVYKMD